MTISKLVRLAIERLVGAHSLGKTRARYPNGFWKCVHSSGSPPFNLFEVGKIYEANESRGSCRIFPQCGGSWSPYWVSSSNGFCYSEDDLKFEYISPSTNGETT